ncbi:MAG: hypothetical protein IKP17_06470 [Oscillospiraceae bacterium]|nr:hypothetical protein [Oscillospiraceae bacterium]
MRYMDMQKELREAIAAADAALESLERARASLRSARNWGIYDILGGGLISGLVKRSRMRSAGEEMEEARRELSRFRRELEDVDRVIDPGFTNFDLGAFGDLFMDGFLFDLIAQGKISDAREQVERAIVEVRRIRSRLAQRLEG